MGGNIISTLLYCECSPRRPMEKAVENFMLRMFTQLIYTFGQKFAVESFLRKSDALHFFAIYLQSHYHSRCTGSHLNASYRQIFSSVQSLEFELSLITKGTLRETELLSIAAEAYSDFIASPCYLEWRLNERRESKLMVVNLVNIETTLPELTSLEDTGIASLSKAIASMDCDVSQHDIDYNDIKSIPKECVLHNKCQLNEMESCETLSIFRSFSNVEIALSSCCRTELPLIKMNHMWLIYLFSAVHTIPFSVTLSKVRLTDYTYPLIYVNQHFKQISCVDLVELINQPGTFMQTNRTVNLPDQMQVLMKLNSKIYANENYVSRFTCYSRGAGFFTNFIGVKPIYSSSLGRVEYILTIQMEERQEISDADSILFISNLIQSLSPDKSVSNSC
mmetsp:Transcript_27395/g.27624  ORF Transcript_27395/g.27624 Transcript_27395/m.27624 type:complete len:392 (-) Transcript_27395:380-1555(-)